MEIQPQTILFVGAPGSGKGTQYNLIKEFLVREDSARGVIEIQTGQLLREYLDTHHNDSFFASRLKEIQYSGHLQPSFIPIHMWTSIFLKNPIDDTKHILIDGTPRTLTEAYVMDSVFYFFKRQNLKVIYFEVSEEELQKRLMARGRHDDTEEVITRRMAEYYTHTVPVIEYLKQSRLYEVITIPADRSVDEIHADVVKVVTGA